MRQASEIGTSVGILPMYLNVLERMSELGIHSLYDIYSWVDNVAGWIPMMLDLPDSGPYPLHIPPIFSFSTPTTNRFFMEKISDKRNQGIRYGM